MQTRDAGIKSDGHAVKGGAEPLQAQVAKAMESYKSGDKAPLKALVAEHGLHLPGMTWDMNRASYAVQADGSFRRMTMKLNKHSRRKAGLGKYTNAQVKAELARVLQEQIAAMQAAETAAATEKEAVAA